MTLKFSIIIPVRDVATYFRECLDSVLTQTFSNCDANCVENRFSGSSGELVDFYAKDDCRVKVFHLPNRGREGVCSPAYLSPVARVGNEFSGAVFRLLFIFALVMVTVVAFYLYSLALILI